MDLSFTLVHIIFWGWQTGPKTAISPSMPWTVCILSCVKIKGKIYKSLIIRISYPVVKVSQVEEELSREWKEKCDKLVANQQQKHKRALLEVRQENEDLQSTIKQLEKKVRFYKWIPYNESPRKKIKEGFYIFFSVVCVAESAYKIHYQPSCFVFCVDGFIVLLFIYCFSSSNTKLNSWLSV